MRLENIEALKTRNRNERAERYIALKRHKTLLDQRTEQI